MQKNPFSSKIHSFWNPSRISSCCSRNTGHFGFILKGFSPDLINCDSARLSWSNNPLISNLKKQNSWDEWKHWTRDTEWRRTTTVQALWAPANMVGVRTSCSRRAATPSASVKVAVVLILRQQKQANEDPPRHHSAPSTPISPVVFCAACFRYRSNACINQREN